MKILSWLYRMFANPPAESAPPEIVCDDCGQPATIGSHCHSCYKRNYDNVQRQRGPDVFEGGVIRDMNILDHTEIAKVSTQTIQDTSCKFKLYEDGRELARVDAVVPRLASWDSKTSPSQQKLAVYLEGIRQHFHGIGRGEKDLYLHLIVGMQTTRDATAAGDLENYLTPLFSSGGFNPYRFSLVSAERRFGKSSMRIGIAEVSPVLVSSPSWRGYSCCAGSGPDNRAWKEKLRSGLEASGHQPVPSGDVDVHMAWRCSSTRNWATSLWKPTGDSMGPILGQYNGDSRFDPFDHRIARIWFHKTIDDTLGHNIDVGLWWRPESERWT